MIDFILASGSPRRKELLELMGLEFKVIVSQADEDSVSKDLKPELYVQELALLKASATAKEVLRNKNAVIISADTIVTLDGQILGKPKDEDDAFNMLSKLSGREHEVYTGYCVMRISDGKAVCGKVRTKVKFKDLSDDKIRGYINSGEPMDNYDNVVKFLELINSEKGLNISQRNITVSTCGIVPKIKELADLKLQITLAISLHAPNDELRKTMMPIANKYSIAEIMDACRYYLDKTGRRISFEYSLVKGVNDTKECANELIELVKGLNCHINLIPVNPIKERDYEQSEKNSIKNFKDMLERKGINATVRREMGRDIDGACGQLRQNHIDENSAI